MFIGEASKLSGATQRAIRLYESVGLLNISREGKYRVYTQTHVAFIKIIREAQTLGISLSEMAILMSEQDEFDWKLVSDFLSQKYKIIDNEIRELEIKKLHIKNCQASISLCLKELDSNP